MTQGSLMWTAVGTTSPRNSAFGRARIRADQHRLVAGGVAGRRDDAHAGHDLRLAVDELEQPRLAERRDVLLQVAGAVALVRVGRVLPFAPLHDVARALEHRRQAAAGRRERVVPPL